MFDSILLGVILLFLVIWIILFISAKRGAAQGKPTLLAGLKPKLVVTAFVVLFLVFSYSKIIAGLAYLKGPIDFDTLSSELLKEDQLNQLKNKYVKLTIDNLYGPYSEGTEKTTSVNKRGSTTTYETKVELYVTRLADGKHAAVIHAYENQSPKLSEFANAWRDYENGKTNTAPEAFTLSCGIESFRIGDRDSVEYYAGEIFPSANLDEIELTKEQLEEMAHLLGLDSYEEIDPELREEYIERYKEELYDYTSSGGEALVEEALYRYALAPGRIAGARALTNVFYLATAAGLLILLLITWIPGKKKEI